jgi:nickel-dependent lactate racemase
VKLLEDIILKSQNDGGITEEDLRSSLIQSVRQYRGRLKKVLLLPPDYTRMHSGGGKISAIYYDLLKDECQVDIMPSLGSHEPMSEAEIREFFGDAIPKERFLVHDWRHDVVKIGEIPGSFVEKISEGLLNNFIDVEVNKRLVDPSYDLIISIGQVVPHEVAGMANHNKNIFVGCGGNSMINKKHMLGAIYGMERVMGKDHSPVREVLDYAERNFLKLPLFYVLTVTTVKEGRAKFEGVFIGDKRSVFEQAVLLSQEKNITFVDKPLKKVVVSLDEKEFKSTWIGNKAIYRTRMAIEDGGELIILAPGVTKFGEDQTNDKLIRKYGYVGRLEVLELCKTNEDLQNDLSVAAHLIHGSSDGRFSITYAVQHLTKEEVEHANFNYMPLEEALRQYDVHRLKDGFNTLANGDEIYFISNPAVGLWASKDRFKQS